MLPTRGSLYGVLANAQYRVEKISSLGMFWGKLLTKPEERLIRRLVEIFQAPHFIFSA
jgi:hypothetical protein